MSVALCLAVLGSFCFAVVIIRALPTVLHRLGLRDRQNDRSPHTGDVLRGGGVGLVIAASSVSGVALVMGGLMREEALAVLGAVLVIAAIGLIDDGVGLSPVIRLAAHLALSLLAAATILHGSSWLVVALAAIAVAGSMNLKNFMDGIDGRGTLVARALLPKVPLGPPVGPALSPSTDRPLFVSTPRQILTVHGALPVEVFEAAGRRIGPPHSRCTN